MCLTYISSGTYPSGMNTVTNVVHRIEQLLDLLPEPLVLRALSDPEDVQNRGR
jgi:hypothetical protein